MDRLTQWHKRPRSAQMNYDTDLCLISLVLENIKKNNFFHIDLWHIECNPLCLWQNKYISK